MEGKKKTDFFYALLSGHQDDYWAKRGSEPFEVEEESEVYRMELVEAGR